MSDRETIWMVATDGTMTEGKATEEWPDGGYEDKWFESMGFPGKLAGRIGGDGVETFTWTGPDPSGRFICSLVNGLGEGGDYFIAANVPALLRLRAIVAPGILAARLETLDETAAKAFRLWQGDTE